jgi:hypothetical protein
MFLSADFITSVSSCLMSSIFLLMGHIFLFVLLVLLYQVVDILNFTSLRFGILFLPLRNVGLCSTRSQVSYGSACSCQGPIFLSAV